MERDEFVDRIVDFGTNEDRFVVTFQQHAAIFWVRRDRRDLAQIAGALAAAWQERRGVKVAADDTEILTVRPG